MIREFAKIFFCTLFGALISFMTRRFSLAFAFTLVSLLLLSACAPTMKPVSTSALNQQSAALLAAGKPEAAARLYLKAATASQPPERQRLQMQAARLLLANKQYRPAQAILDHIDSRSLTHIERAQLALLRAELELARKQPRVALNMLPGRVSGLPAPLAAQILQVRAQASQAAGLPLPAIEARVLRQPLLQGADTEKNLEALWQLLMQTPPQTLESWRNKANSKPLEAWLSLALIAQTTPPRMSALQTALARWKADYAKTAVEAQPILDQMQMQWQSFHTYPSQIAVLLPLSGPYKAAGQSILDGIVTAYYADRGDFRPPILRIYNTGADPAGIVALYRRAVADGAQFVIGPLVRVQIEKLLESNSISTPTLALNYLPAPASNWPADFYEFSLSPENQARQVAQKAWSDGRRTAVILIPDSRWGTRVAKAFTQQFTQLGGKVLSVARYSTQSSDYASSITHALNIDRSNARMRALATTLGRRLHFEPHRRQDTDMIFIAGTPQQARLLLPQIDFHHGNGLPIYSISAAYSGIPNQRSDSDLDGLIFPDEPLLLARQGPPAAIRTVMLQDFPETFRRYPRLLALGADSFDVIPYLSRLKKQPWASYQGLSGVLRLVDGHEIESQLMWARFTQGVPQPINSPLSTESGATSHAPAP